MSPYEKAKTRRLIRIHTLSGKPITLEPGVNFFVEALERSGAKIRFTCEGHPHGFSIVFDAPYAMALSVINSGFFGIAMMREKNRWSLNMRGNEEGIKHENGEFTFDDRNDILSSASECWEKSDWFIPPG